jgi:hypothetical protein
MTHQHGAKRPGVSVAVCSSCKQAHLVITEAGRNIASIAMTREEWAKLIGAYGDIITLIDNQN